MEERLPKAAAKDADEGFTASSAKDAGEGFPNALGNNAGEGFAAAPGRDIRGALPEELAELMKSLSEPAYRGRQIFAWIHREKVSDFDQMTNISKSLRDRLDADYPLVRSELIRRRVSADGTKKYLFALEDGVRIESVLMSHREETGHIRHTICLSTQAGCAMGCAFCATAGMGFKRNLTAGEIVGQVLDIAAIEQADIHNLVYMGMGEPLLNPEAVKRSILILNHPLGLNIGARRFTVSTCGLPDGIRAMAGWGLDAGLAVSLHAADDETRSRLMPVNRRHPLAELMAACRDYQAASGRRFTFEYVMIKGVNTGAAEGEKLGRMLKGMSCNINLIPVNPGGHGFARPGEGEQKRFIKELERAGLNPVLRQERGADVGGACGQLAAEN
ncbi:MAG: 23S rRNA (adenine(2503)-C(2))-methyltransferase RlmN [Clostridiales bacterium]|nr:23S rRNA (adenine(2503)-C(2))-methyltransferase RlmN [Clostridiales bacterium]